MSIVVRKSASRGYANHGWLKSYHTFSFANYNDPRFEGFGPLRVINEDRVSPGKGFPTHGHRDFEIYSYVVSGELEHKDSMGNVEKIKRGEVQFTTAGTGIRHSEYNRHRTDTVHFIQIWHFPSQSNLTPSYQTKMFTDKQKLNTLCPIVSGQEKVISGSEGIIRAHQDLTTFACILDEGSSIQHTIQKNRMAYIHLIQKGDASVTLNGTEILVSGDGAFFLPTKHQHFHISIQGLKKSEFLLFDLPRT